MFAAQRSLRALGSSAVVARPNPLRGQFAARQLARRITSASGGFRNTATPDSFDPTSYRERALPAGRHPLDPTPPGLIPKWRALEDLDRPSVVRGVRALLYVGAVAPPYIYMKYIDPEMVVDMKMWLLQQGLPDFTPTIWIPLILAEASWPVRTLLSFYLFRFFYEFRSKFMRPF